MTPHYTKDELLALGFKAVGEHCQISRKTSFYGCQRISLGNFVRIDDFCVLSAGEGGINLGNYIHIAVFSTLIGAGRITVNDFCNISSRVSIYSSNDDYSGEFMTNPMVPDAFTNVSHQPVCLQKHVIIGAGSVILPNVTLAEGVAVGALSLVNLSLSGWGIYAGQPAKFIKARSQRLLTQENKFLAANKMNQQGFNSKC